MHATCVDLTDVLGRGDAAHLRPLRTAAGPLLVPIDRAIDRARLERRRLPVARAPTATTTATPTHRPPPVGRSTARSTTRTRALAQARADAADFVARVARARRAAAASACARSTPSCSATGGTRARRGWPRCSRRRRARASSSSASTTRCEAPDAGAAPAELPATTWGTPRDLSTWSGAARSPTSPGGARDAELRVVAAGARGRRCGAVRELLALQSSDWAFLATGSSPAPYPRERAAGHAAALRAALAADPRRRARAAQPRPARVRGATARALSPRRRFGRRRRARRTSTADSSGAIGTAPANSAAGHERPEREPPTAGATNEPPELRRSAQAADEPAGPERAGRVDREVVDRDADDDGSASGPGRSGCPRTRRSRCGQSLRAR